MNKKLIYGFAIIAGLASCNDDYTDWSRPQSNSEHEAVEKLYNLLLKPLILQRKQQKVFSCSPPIWKVVRRIHLH